MKGVREEKIRVFRDHDAAIVKRDPIDILVAGCVSCGKIQRMYRFMTMPCQYPAQPSREMGIHDKSHASVR